MPRNSSIKRFLLYLLALGAVATVYSYYHGGRTLPVLTKIPSLVENLRQAIAPAPCTQLIKYAVGTLDGRFGLTSQQFKDDIAKAAGVWDASLGRPIFQYSTASPDVTVNLIYDYRQETTLQLQKLGIVIKDDRTTYEELKTKYNSLHAQYIESKAALEADIAAYNAHKQAYEQKVNTWNSQGGAPPEEYAKMRDELAALNAEGRRVSEEQSLFNDLVSTLNFTAGVLNRLAGNLNLHVAAYNTVGSSAGEQFDEGQYMEDASGQRINIYQYNDQNKLIRVLEHELGHAIGLEHVDDPKAIMYKLNQSTNEKPTAADIAELKRVCNM